MEVGEAVATGRPESRARKAEGCFEDCGSEEEEEKSESLELACAASSRALLGQG
jgi:hypothetical protein